MVVERGDQVEAQPEAPAPVAVGFARSIHAVTPRGFELKVFLTVLAYAITA